MNYIPGNTKIVKLDKIKELFNLDCDIYAKVENTNPTGSIKDRTVYNMLKHYESIYGTLDGFTIVEATSGNTGISLSFYQSIFKYKCIIVMPVSASLERREMIKKYNGTLELVNGGMKECNIKAQDIISSTPNSFIFDQFNQKSNLEAHYSTAKEIYEEDLGIRRVFAGIGTGGTVTGIAQYFNDNNINISVIGIEPFESPLITKGYANSHLIQGIGANFIPSILNTDILEDVICVKGEDAVKFAKIVRDLEGIDCGISSGASLIGMINYIKLNNIKESCLCIMPDKGDRYSW